MDIIVLLKQVPDTTEAKLDPKTGNLIREGLKSVINPDDRHALEAAVQIKETVGGKVTVVSMGPPQAIDALTEAIGLGADQAVLLTDRLFAGADTWSTAYTLGKAVEKIGSFDLIISGRQAIDGDTAQIGPQVADHLGVPQVTYVIRIEAIEKDHIVVHRLLEDGYERIRCRLPGLITVVSDLNKPRYPNIEKLINGCNEKAPIKIWNAAELNLKADEVGLDGSLTQVIKTFAPKFERQGELLEGSKQEIVRQLIQRLGQSEGATACKAVAAACQLFEQE
ncbi:MAG: electron transfer flavoprotein subunit beta/FixA family protein [Desulfatiglandaceae bacterium]